MGRRQQLLSEIETLVASGRWSELRRLGLAAELAVEARGAEEAAAAHGLTLALLRHDARQGARTDVLQAWCDLLWVWVERDTGPLDPDEGSNVSLFERRKVTAR
jgi:hypothetical protein